MAHSSVGPSPAEPDPWPVPAPLHGHVGSRFGEVRSLGPSATLGRAFRALDRQEKQQVVLRYLPDTDRPTATGEALHRQLAADPNERPPGFFRESLGEPRREGRVVLRGFVEGRALAEHLDRAPLPLTDALELLEAIAADLERAHDLGVLHGNLTPSNIVVPGERFGDATVVDYGLRPVVRDPETLEDVDRPLARYVSPEHAGLIDEEPGPAADLYLVGLVFYHALAGRFPYEGDDVGSLLRAHVTEEPEPIRRMRPQLPRAVDQVLDRLLRPDPAERYRSAKGLLADVRELRDRLAGAERDHPFVVGTQEERDTLARPGFLDRETELAALEDQTAATARGQGGLAKIEAVSGGGKTRLIREFLERSPLGGIQLLQAQVHEAVAQRPFQAVREVVHAVADRCERDATEARRLTEALGDHVAAVCEAFPPLADALGVDPPSSLGPDEYGEERTLAALSRFIDAIGTAEEPALVIVDDAQWADELTLRLLRRWARSDPPEGARYTTVVVAFRSDEVPGDAILREAEASLDLALDLFTDEQVRDLARSMAGPLPEDALDVLTRLAEGNPFMTTAVLRGLIESQALVHEDGR